jgi:AraC-like DNA-binding protein
LSKKDGLVFDIKKYIDTNINTNLTLEMLSKEFLVTPFYIIKIFKQEFGFTPYQYILNAKINLSKKLISHNNSIAEVALECGFNDQSHLYKYFKQVFSITPKEYQKSIKR